MDAETPRIRVRAMNNVLGMSWMQEAEVLATEEVEFLVAHGHLEWLDAPVPEVEEPPKRSRKPTTSATEPASGAGDSESDA